MTVQSKFSMAVFAVRILASLVCMRGNYLSRRSCGLRIAHKFIISLQNESLSSFEFFGNLGDFRRQFREFSVIGQNRRVQHGFD